MYLDDKLVNAEHLCRLALARTKYKYTYEQDSKQVHFFLERMSSLYKLEEEYCKENLTSEEVQSRRKC